MGAQPLVSAQVSSAPAALADVHIYRWLGAAASNWAAIVAAFVAVALLEEGAHGLALVAVVPLAVVVIGTRQHALALLTHEGAHLLCSRHRGINDFLATFLCAYPLGASLRSYRKFHLAHHRNVGTRDDPELEFKAGMGSRWTLPITRARLVRRALMDCIGLGMPDVLQTFKTLRPRETGDWVAYAGFWLVVSTVLVSTGLAWCLALWLVSIGTAQWAAFRVRIWTEHAGLPEGQTHRFHANWWQRWLFFPMNTWCHYEHHASAATPFYRLPALRRELDAVPILTVGQVFELLARAPASDQTATAR
jgi:fatty acid desaturase